MENRYIFFLLISLFSLTISCKKDEPTVPLLQPKDIAGMWELTYMKGATPGDAGSVDANTGNLIIFRNPGFEKFSNEHRVAMGTYQLIKEKNVYTGNENGYRIAYKFDEVANGYDTESKEYVMIVNGKLVLYTSLYEETYVKLKDF